MTASIRFFTIMECLSLHMPSSKPCTCPVWSLLQLHGIPSGVCLDSLATLVDDPDVIVEYGCNDRNHISLDNPSPYILRAANPNIEHTLKGEIPFPHLHHLLASSLLENAYQPFHAAVDGENIPDSSRGGCQVGQMIQGVNQGQRRGTIEGAAVVQSGSNAHRRLVDIGDAEIDFSHLHRCSRVGLWLFRG